MRVWIVAIWLSVLIAAPVAHASPFADPFATYAETVLADAPEVYWRLGETSGTIVADAPATDTPRPSRRPPSSAPAAARSPATPTAR